MHCDICPQRCIVSPGEAGSCGTRGNVDGELRLLTYGRVVAASLDPIEKKPLRHFHPGSRVYTYALPGCTLNCRFCQNWEIAHGVPRERFEDIPYQDPARVVEAALSAGGQGVACSYTEPVAGLEYALEVMQLARRAGMFTVWHTNGYMTPPAARAAAPWLDAACIDLKAVDDQKYRRLTGGALAPVLDTARIFKDAGVWLEFSTPILQGVNDSPDDIGRLASLIGDNFGPEAPWHLLRGHPAYRLVDIPITSPQAMDRAAGIGRETGLRRVYACW